MSIITIFLRTFLPTIFGILTVWGMFKIQAIIHIFKYGPDDIIIDSDLLFLLPLVIFGLFIQLTCMLPIWSRFKRKEKIMNLNLIQLVGLICVVGGLSFGFFLWAPQFGIRDLIIASLIGVISLSSYWTINLVTLNQLDKWIKK